jgi:predicted dienelactone hydrolase
MMPVSIALLALACFGVAASAPGEPPAYDPLESGTGDTEVRPPAPLDLDIEDDSRQRRIPLRVWLPAADGPAPVILFSHGLGGSREGNAYLGRHWSARGYCVIFLQHAGSDEAVWRELPFPERLPALKRAVNLTTTLERYRDVPAALDRLTLWNVEASHPLAGRLELSSIGISGHSFGAVTSQGVAGQSVRDGRQPFTDPRIGAALLMSPSVPKWGNATRAFGGVDIPWMIMTGTEDDSPIGNATPLSRREVYAALPPGAKYELVLAEGEHQAFGDRVLPGSKRPRNPNHHRVVLALSTAFWDAFLRGDAAARAWLESDGPRRVLEPRDAWQWK